MVNKIIIIGGLSAGPSAAAKARREDENAEIILFEKTTHISYATCGIPYALSGKIKDREKLMVVKPDLLRKRFNIDVRLNEAVIDIDPEKQEVTTHKGTYQYNKLVYATGGSPIIPPITNLDKCNLWSTCKTIEDFDKIIKDKVLDDKQSVAIIGAGLIGLEAAENLKKAGKTVHVIERDTEILPILSTTYSRLIQKVLKDEHINLHLNTTAELLDLKNKKLLLDNGVTIDTEYLIIGIGVKPNTELLPEAKKAANGALVVDDKMQTSLPNIYAAGDCVVLKNLLSDNLQYFPMGTHSNKGGRAAGAQIGGSEFTHFKGAYGTAIVKIFDYTVARTGLIPTRGSSQNFPYKCSLIVASNTPGFYPNPSDVYLSIFYDPKTLVVVGAEAFGKKGIDKRIDVLATAIYARLTLTDLQNLDLAYAPPFSPAKDPLIVASYAAENELKGTFKTMLPLVLKDVLERGLDIQLLDVRDKDEIEKSGKIGNAINIPLDDLRDRLDEVDSDKSIYLYCAKGMRGYIAARILHHHGFKNIYNVSGGFTTWQALGLPIEMTTHAQQYNDKNLATIYQN